MQQHEVVKVFSEAIIWTYGIVPCYAQFNCSFIDEKNWPEQERINNKIRWSLCKVLFL